MTKAQRDKVVELNSQLTAASDAYYKKNQPLMSDATFDTLERELRGIIAAHPELRVDASFLDRVGSDVTGSGRILHARPMLSIENMYTEEDLLEWYAKLPPGTDVCLEPKFDGISVSLVYKDWHLVRALTRGDGKSGEDITRQAYAVESIPKILNRALPHNLEVRGELVMKNSTLERINREAEKSGGKVYSSTRNLTGGTMKLKDMSLIPDREIQIRPWDVLGEELPDSGVVRLAELVSSGFPPPLGKVVSDSSSIIALLKQKLAERQSVLRDVMSLETDGLVIKVDSNTLRRQLGISSKYTNYQVCFKPQSASGTTYLRSIDWQVGRTGKLSPVATCDPVILAGAKVEHANLNNITWIKEKGLKFGAKVEMLRSGDVIPQIVRVLDEGESEIIPPSNCPECLTLLEESDEGGAGTLTHRCPNSLCPGRTTGTLTFIGSREVLEIDGLGPEMARKLVEMKYARDLGELYTFQKECMSVIGTSGKSGEEAFINSMRKKAQGGFDSTIIKMIYSLEAAKTASWERWIKALCIPMIGATLGKTVAMDLDLQPDDFEMLVSTILLPFTTRQTDGFGEAKMGAIRDWCTEANNKLCRTLYEAGVRPTAVAKPKVAEGAPLKGISFCITGEFAADREAIIAKLISLGAASKSGVSSKVNLLIVGSGAGKSKTKKADELKIKQVGEEWLVKTLTQNGLRLEA